jgi:hypothetical protein
MKRGMKHEPRVGLRDGVGGHRAAAAGQQQQR